MKLLCWCALLLLAAAGTCAAVDDASTLLMQAKSHYVRRIEPGEAAQAILLFEKALTDDPNNYEAAWQLSRALWFAGNHATVEKKKQYYEKGIDAGHTAVGIQPRGCEGHFWAGVNTALLAENSGKLKALGLVDDVKNALQKSLELNPDCECAGPQRVLGKLYSEIPWFKGGSDKKAIDYLKASLQRCPDDTQSRMFLAEIYLDEGKKGLAIQQFKLVLKQEPDPAWLPETIENKNKAEQRLKELGTR